MKTKNLVLMIVAAVVLVCVAKVTTQREEEGGTDGAMGRKVLPDLDLNAIERVVFATGSATATVSRINGTWCSDELYGYPANFGKLKGLLLKLADMKVGQIVGLDDKDKDTLKLRAPGAGPADSTGTEVRMLDKDGKPAATLLVGDSRKRKQSEGDMMGRGGYPDGRFISADGGATVCLVSEDLYDLSAQPKDWVEPEVVNVSGSSLSEVTFEHPDGTVLKLAKPQGSANLKVEDLASEEEMEMSKVYSIESALSYLRFDEIASPSLSADQMGLVKGARFTARTTDGEVYKVTVGGSPTNSDMRYVQVAASFVAPPEVKKADSTNATEKAAEDKAAEERAKKRAETETKIADLNKKLGSWVYLLSAQKTGSMVVKRDQVVKKKEPPKEDKPAATATNSGPAAAVGAAPSIPTPAPVDAPASGTSGSVAPAPTQVSPAADKAAEKTTGNAAEKTGAGAEAKATDTK